MKIPRALMLVLILPALAVACAAQEARPTPTPEEFQTKLESLMSETGAVIVKGYTRVGSMNGSRGAASITAWEVTNARTGRREQGVAVEIGDASSRPFRRATRATPLSTSSRPCVSATKGTASQYGSRPTDPPFVRASSPL